MWLTIPQRLNYWVCITLVKWVVYYLNLNSAILLILLLPWLNYIAVSESFHVANIDSAWKLSNLRSVLSFCNTSKYTRQSSTPFMWALDLNSLDLSRTPQTHHHILLEKIDDLLVSVGMNFELALCAMLDS